MIYHLDSLCYVYEIDWSRVMIINSSKVNMIPIGGEVYSIQLYVVKFVNDICTDGTFSSFFHQIIRDSQDTAKRFLERGVTP